MSNSHEKEISRTQIWQWVHHGARLSDGRVVDGALVQRTIRQQLEKIRDLIGSARFDSGNFDRAAQLFEEMSLSENFPDFLTVSAYDFLD